LPEKCYFMLFSFFNISKFCKELTEKCNFVIQVFST
jgi:hypothetical protein